MFGFKLTDSQNFQIMTYMWALNDTYFCSAKIYAIWVLIYCHICLIYWFKQIINRMFGLRHMIIRRLMIKQILYLMSPTNSWHVMQACPSSLPNFGEIPSPLAFPACRRLMHSVLPKFRWYVKCWQQSNASQIFFGITELWNDFLGLATKQPLNCIAGGGLLLHSHGYFHLGSWALTTRFFFSRLVHARIW